VNNESESCLRPLSETELLWVTGGMNKSELVASVADKSSSNSEEQSD